MAIYLQVDRFKSVKMKELNSTAHRLLDQAEAYTQRLGFSGFSYRDLQNSIGIKTSSIHYYFPSKQDLAEAMIMRYNERYQLMLDALAEKHLSPFLLLKAYANLFYETAKDNKFCLCGMMAVDTLNMPGSVNNALQAFHALNIAWLEKQMATIKSPNGFAQQYFLTLEASVLFSRTFKRPEYVLEQADQMLANLQ